MTKKNQLKSKIMFFYIVFFAIICISGNASAQAGQEHFFDSSNTVVCDTYDIPTDTCTISGLYDPTPNPGDDAKLHFNFQELIITPTGSIVNNGLISIDTDNLTIEGSIYQQGTPAHNPEFTINSKNLIISTTGSITDDSGPFDINISEDGSIEGQIIYGTSNWFPDSDVDITITAKNLAISGQITRGDCEGGNFEIEVENNLDITGQFTINFNEFCAEFESDLNIDAKKINMQGNINAFENIRINSNILDFYGTIPLVAINPSGPDYYSHTTITTDSMNFYAPADIASETVYINYCFLTPDECKSAVSCPYISTPQVDTDITQTCTNSIATCDAGDGCTIYDPATLTECLVPDPDCPTSHPTPTLLSLHGTVTDTDDNLINGTVNVTSFEQCDDTTCTSKTPVDTSGAVNDINFENGIINSMIGPYNLIVSTTYMMTVKICETLTGLCDTGIEIKFTN